MLQRHVAEAFPPARQGTILNSHRVIGIATAQQQKITLENIEKQKKKVVRGRWCLFPTEGGVKISLL